MSGKFALVIGNSRYDDASLGRLKAPDIDVHELESVLKSPDVGRFDEVTTLLNEDVASVSKAIARFYDQRQRDDLLLLYFSGHGLKDEQGHLYLALRDTESALPAGSAIETAFITSRMDRCFSKRQVLVLDCCHSGAFARGTKAAQGISVGTAEAFEGTGLGRVVLTATDSTQYAWEGDQIIGDAQASLFTHFLIEGLKTGAADRNKDGDVTVDELYDYVREHVMTTTPRQTPHKWSYLQHGDIVLAQNPFAKRSVLPAEIADAMSNTRPGLRFEAVGHLESLLHGDDAGLAHAALGALKALSTDDSRKVAKAAALVVRTHEGKTLGASDPGTTAQSATDTRDPARPSDIFISYAHEDHEKARALADVLAARGWKVWWDRKIAPGEAYDVVIERELGTCQCAIVLWSARSVHATWVRNEARRAARRQVLLPILIDAVEMPLEFENLQAADLTSWSETGEPPELEAVIERILAVSPVPNEVLARNVVEQARREVKAGRRETAVSRLERFRPRHYLVSRALAELRGEGDRLERDRNGEVRRDAEAARVEQERAETARREAEAARIEREGVEARRREVEAARVDQERAETARLGAEAARVERERVDAERREAEAARVDQERAETARCGAEAARVEQERAETARRGEASAAEKDEPRDEATRYVWPLPSPPPRPPSRSMAVDENVQFTVYRPSSIEPETWHSMLAFAHLSERPAGASASEPDPIQDVRRQAERILGSKADQFKSLTQDSPEAVPRESTITFVPVMTGVTFNPLSRQFQWTEPVHREDFRLRAAASLSGTTARGRLSVYLGSLLVADVPLAIGVDRGVRQAPPQPAIARPYRSIFASYSRRDVAIVREVESYAAALGDRYARDVVDLRSGEVWSDRLRDMIEHADIFQLFWSSNAMTSAFVRAEWEHAIGLNRSSFVRPVFWETPFPEAPDLPPTSLRRLHFTQISIGSVFGREPAPAPPPVDLPHELEAARREYAARRDQEALEAARREEAEAARRDQEALEAARREEEALEAARPVQTSVFRAEEAVAASRPEPPGLRLNRPRWSPRLLAAAASVVLLLTTGLVFVKMISHPVPPDRTSMTPLPEPPDSATARPVGGDIQPPPKLHDVPPIVPPVARDAHISGSVGLTLVIGPDGRVTSATITRSIPLLDQAALDAVRGWIFAPTTVRGRAVSVTMPVTVDFPPR